MLTRPPPPRDLLLWGRMALMIVHPVLYSPCSKTLFIAIDQAFRSRGPGDFDQPREPAARQRV